jgi:hypothetical protein
LCRYTKESEGRKKDEALADQVRTAVEQTIQKGAFTTMSDPSSMRSALSGMAGMLKVVAKKAVEARKVVEARKADGGSYQHDDIRRSAVERERRGDEGGPAGSRPDNPFDITGQWHGTGAASLSSLVIRRSSADMLDCCVTMRSVLRVMIDEEADNAEEGRAALESLDQRMDAFRLAAGDAAAPREEQHNSTGPTHTQASGSGSRRDSDNLSVYRSIVSGGDIDGESGGDSPLDKIEALQRASGWMMYRAAADNLGLGGEVMRARVRVVLHALGPMFMHVIMASERINNAANVGKEEEEDDEEEEEEEQQQQQQRKEEIVLLITITIIIIIIIIQQQRQQRYRYR